MTLSFRNSTELARCVRDTTESLKPGSQLTMIISRERYGAFSVSIATGVKSVDTGTESYYDALRTT